MLTVCFALQGESCRGSGLERGGYFVQSVRQHLPEATIVQLSNDHFPAVPGIDRVQRRPNTGDFIQWAFRSMLDLFDQVHGPVLQLATDIVVKHPVSHIFNDSFDVAACRYPEKDRTDGAYCGDTNFVHRSGFPIWENALAHYERNPNLRDGWEGGQTALLWAFRQPGVRVLDLDFDTYNFTPDAPGQVPESAKIVHYRGLRKIFMAQDCLNGGTHGE